MLATATARATTLASKLAPTIAVSEAQSMTTSNRGAPRILTHFPAALALLFLSSATWACECDGFLLDAANARKQQHVFAFRVVSLQAEPGRLPRAGGRIELLDAAKGDARQFKRVRINTGQCCGTRLRTGSVYWAFTSQRGPILYAHAGNILALPDCFHDASPDGVSGAVVRDLLAGKEAVYEDLWLRSFAALDCPVGYGIGPEDCRASCEFTGTDRPIGTCIQLPTPPPGSRTPAPATSTPRPRN